MGTGGNASNSYGCAPQYGGGQYGYNQAGCGPAGSYGVAGNGFGANTNGYGMGAGGFGAGTNGYGMGAGNFGANTAGHGMGAGGFGAGATGYGMGAAGAAGLRGATGAAGYGMTGAAGYGMGAGGAYGAQGTVLGGAAPYGRAVGGGAQYANSGQYINGQWVAGSGGMTTVQGAPIYVPQPYPAYYGVGYNAGLRGASAAMPFGIEASIGRDFYHSGDVFGGAPSKPSGLNTISALDAVSYKDAYAHAQTYGLTATYDVDPSTTLLGSVGWSKAEGERMKVGTITNASGSLTEDLHAQWGDLEEVTLEGGVRKYVGGWNNSVSGVRPYVQATAGFAHNNAVDIVQDSASLAPASLNTQQYIDDGWTPTASGMVGAEMQVGPRTALGIETGVRWRDNLDTNLPSEDRWSIPLNLRGRVSF